MQFVSMSSEKSWSVFTGYINLQVFLGNKGFFKLCEIRVYITDVANDSFKLIKAEQIN